jgi:hypothetical protein
MAPISPPMNPPNYTPTSSPWGVPPTPGPWTPKPPTAPKAPPITPLNPWTYQSGVNGGLMGNLPAPAYGNGSYPTPPQTQGVAGPAPAPRQEGPYGNWFDPTSGVDGDWKDAWGNIIAHMNVTPGAGGAGAPNAGFPQVYDLPAPAAPTAPVPGVPTPPGQMPNTFYAPTTGSPYLQLPSNFLSYLGDTERKQFIDSLRGAGFQDTGAYGLNGPSDFIKPPDFDESDIQALTQSDNVRQWMRFFMGNLGYGIGYQLPGGYVPGSGLPAAPPWPGGSAPWGASTSPVANTVTDPARHY